MRTPLGVAAEGPAGATSTSSSRTSCEWWSGNVLSRLLDGPTPSSLGSFDSGFDIAAIVAFKDVFTGEEWVWLDAVVTDATE
jgi:hypothetical protein